ncbi:hypothetical protein IIA79_05460, partial [bacterium]|nr:hypothetical protein [bacterium]
MSHDSGQLLYGSDPAGGLAGCAPHDDGVTCWWLDGNGRRTETLDYKPFFLISHPELLDDFKPSPGIAELAGDNHYRFRVSTDNWKHHDEAAAHVSRAYRAGRADYPHDPLLKFSDPSSQYLLASGRTHFKGLSIDDLSILFLALRAYNSESADFADPSIAEDSIVLAGLADGKHWLRIFELGKGGEEALINEVSAAVIERDPDVIVGHDLFKGSMAYFTARAKRYRVKLPWGRDESQIKVRRARAPAAEKQLEYPRADIAGRHLVDTWFLAQYYDIVKRDLERFDAPYVARYLDRNCALPDPVPPWDVGNLFDHKRAVLGADIKYELEASAVIFNTLIGSNFAQSQMLPLSLQDSVVRGNASKINLLLMREYLRRGESIPAPVESRHIVGGHTELRLTGLIRNVLNVDMASL